MIGCLSDCLYQNNIIWNLSSQNLNNEEYDDLSYVLNHGLAINLDCNGVLSSMESVWDEITRKIYLKKTTVLLIKLKTASTCF